MARYTVTFKSEYAQEELEDRVAKYLLDKKFRKAIYKDEEGVYKLGSGFWTAPKFVKYSVEGNEVTLEAWIKAFAIFGESGVTGFVGMVPKRQLKKLVDTIEEII